MKYLLPTMTAVVCMCAATYGQSLGPVFESKTLGVAVKPPAGCVIDRNTSTEETVNFINVAGKTNLRIIRSQLGQSLELTNEGAIPTNANVPVPPGYMELNIDQFTGAAPESQLLSREIKVLDLGGLRRQVGILVFRHTVIPDHRLTQQAIFRVSDKIFYIFEMSTASETKPKSSDKAEGIENDAIQTFRELLNSVRFLDQREIRSDQDNRLIRTRGLFLNLTSTKLAAALVPQAYYRHIKDGKDIGYSYVIEEPAEQTVQKGFQIGMRTRMVPEPGTQIDSESWFFSTWDRWHENWSNISYADDGKERVTIQEIGVSNREEVRQFDKPDKIDPNAAQRPLNMRKVEAAEMSVTIMERGQRLPVIKQPLPAFYATLAIDYLLPRVVGSEQKTYMLARWVPERRKVMLEYIDVGREEAAFLGDKAIRAIPVKVKLGLEGAVTTHYITREGQFAGSINEEEKTMTIPATEAELLRIWKDADLSRPKTVDAR